MARANLEAKLSADTSVFTRAMAAAQLQTRQWAADVTNRVGIVGGSLDKVAKASRNLQGQLIALVGVGTLSAIAREVDNIGDAAANLEVSASFLDSLGQAARLTGTDAQTATAAMEKMLQVIGDARRREGTAFETLADLGIDIDQVRDNEAAVFAIAKAMGELKTNAERASVATELFGRSGKKITELFADGEEGLRGYIEEVERLGIVTSDTTTQIVGGLVDDIGTRFKQIRTVGADALAGVGVALAGARGFITDFRESQEKTLSVQAAWKDLNETGLGFDFLKSRATAALDAIKSAAESANDEVDKLTENETGPIPRLPRQPTQGGGGAGFAAPFLFEAFRRAFPGIAEQGAAAQFADLSRSFPGIPLSGAGQGALEVWEAQRRLENELVESKGRRAEREGNPPPGGSIRLDTDTQLMLQELRRNSKQLEKIEQNTAPLRE